ncbi:MAG: multidrug effflux MFS transporter [Inquilinus sp.]|nr:multidrug effflux MFS transporter [Inquilinus sp.]
MGAGRRIVFSRRDANEPLSCAPSAPQARKLPVPRSDSLAVAVLLTALVAFGPISTDLYLPSLPAMTRALATDVATMQLTLSVFLVGFSVSQLIYGPLSDRFGRRPVLLAGVAIYVVAGIACALAPTVEALIVGRFFQALGACAGPVVARAVVRDVHGRARSARVLAYMAMAMSLAPAIGPILGGHVEVWFGWRANLWLLVGFGAAALAATWTLLAETNRHRDPLATSPARLVRNYRLLLGDPGYLGFLLVVAFTYSGIFAFISGSSFVFVDLVGLGPVAYGFCFAGAVVGYMAGSFLSGRLTLRLGIERMVGAGTLLSALGGAAMLACALAFPPGVVPILAPFFVFMVGAGLVLPNATAGAIGPFPTMAGFASALLGFVQMGVAARVGVAVGHLTDASAVPMAAAVAAVSLAAAIAFRVLVPPAEFVERNAGHSPG